MKRPVFLITLAALAGSLLAGCPTLPVVAAIHSTLPVSPSPHAAFRIGEPADNRMRPIKISGPLCAHPMPHEVQRCDELEQQILASTIRIEWHHWIKSDDGGGYTRVDGIGHATIKEGRYLVTHNHSGILQSDLRNSEFNRISVITANGVPLWLKGPLYPVTVVVQDEETLVLDFGDYGGQGLFALMSVPSAEFKAWDSLPLEPGTEVAQVTWDGAKARVEWVTIDEIKTNNGTPRLELDNIVAEGASGGGVFWNGSHVANTWSQKTVLNANSGAVLRQYSVAALNSPQVTAPIQ
jgi:hypothetical protein